MRVMLVDDTTLVRDGIASLLRAQNHTVVAEASSGTEAVELAAKWKPDLILMDIFMPEMSGLEATRLIKASYPEINIVMLTVSDDEHDLFEAIKSGADGYLLKDLTAQQLMEEIQALERGEAVINRRLAGRLLEEFKARPVTQMPAPEADLSPREREVLSLVAQGLSNKEVSERLFVTENTVKFHMKHILNKLHMRSRAQVIAWANRRQAGELRRTTADEV